MRIRALLVSALNAIIPSVFPTISNCHGGRRVLISFSLPITTLSSACPLIVTLHLVSNTIATTGMLLSFHGKVAFSA
nr:hypothetical protein [Sinorhizobium meliloti]